MKASPLILVLCLSVASAEAGPRFGGAHAIAQRNLRFVSDIEPGPVPPPPSYFAPPPEPQSFAPPVPEPVYLPAPYIHAQAPPLLRMIHSGPRILYLRKPSNKPGPVVIYGSG